MGYLWAALESGFARQRASLEPAYPHLAVLGPVVDYSLRLYLRPDRRFHTRVPHVVPHLGQSGSWPPLGTRYLRPRETSWQPGCP